MNNTEEDNQKVKNKYLIKYADSLVAKAGISKAPVRLNSILKTLALDIKILCEDMGDADGFSLGTKLICYNSHVAIVRQRFTFAHELGHILLGHNSDGIRRKIDLKSKDPKEIEANIFASYILIPEMLLKKEKVENETVSTLAKKYNVSQDSMKWRIINSKYIYKIKSLD